VIPITLLRPILTAYTHSKDITAGDEDLKRFCLKEEENFFFSPLSSLHVLAAIQVISKVTRGQQQGVRRI